MPAVGAAESVQGVAKPGPGSLEGGNVEGFSLADGDECGTTSAGSSGGQALSSLAQGGWLHTWLLGTGPGMCRSSAVC